MRKSLWIDIWNDRRKEKVIQRQQQGYSFLQSYTMTNFKNTLMELAKGLGMYKGSPTSCYVVIIPPNRKEVIRVRLSDHPSTKDEWVAGEITGLPNRRYSIVIFSNKSMPLQSKQNVKETDWTNYDVEGIPVYEKCFNRIYLKDTIQTLLNILISIYEGKSPSTGSTQITKENKQNTNINKNMKKQTIKLNEENINSEHWNNKIDMLLRTLQYLKDHLENGLFVVDGFVGGQRMEIINRIGLCCMALNDILDKGGITLTDKSVPVASPYKLNESQLRNIIKESIKKVLRESAGHLYFHDEEGRPYTNSKETWRGVPGTTYIYHGEWADPEVWYEGYEINYNDLEDFMFDIYNSECTEDGIEATEEGYESWMEKQGTSWIKATLDEYISNINLPS